MRYARHVRHSESRAAQVARNLKRRTAPVEPAETVEAWPLRMDPKTYLALHPDGKHAALARHYAGGDA